MEGVKINSGARIGKQNSCQLYVTYKAIYKELVRQLNEAHIKEVDALHVHMTKLDRKPERQLNKILKQVRSGKYEYANTK